MIQVFDKLKTNNKTHIKELKIKCICVVYMAKYKINSGKMNKSIISMNCFLIKSININKITL